MNVNKKKTLCTYFTIQSQRKIELAKSENRFPQKLDLMPQVKKRINHVVRQ